jgi:hypothetical protein
MTGRNRAFAAAGVLHLGERLDAVLKLLPEARRAAISRHMQATPTFERLRAGRKREQQMVERVALCVDAEPRMKRWMIDRLVAVHGRK